MGCHLDPQKYLGEVLLSVPRFIPGTLGLWSLLHPRESVRGVRLVQIVRVLKISGRLLADSEVEP